MLLVVLSGHMADTTAELLVLSLSAEKKLKSVNIWQSYKQERGCLVHFARLANTLLKDEESVRDNHVLARNFVKYITVKNSPVDSATNLS